MTDVLKTQQKKAIRRALIQAALAVLEREGWKVGKEGPKIRGRVRQITKNGRALVAAIRTSQDGWIAFPRNRKDTKWITLADVDVVIAAAVDDPAEPKFAQVHMFEAKELRERFDRAYTARLEAGHSIPRGRGVWVSLYYEETSDPVNRVGAGIGIAHPPIAQVPLDQGGVSDSRPPVIQPTSEPADGDAANFQPLTIQQAKVRLARSLGVDPGSIKITVEA
jgi:hypothetical protein